MSSNTNININIIMNVTNKTNKDMTLSALFSRCLKMNCVDCDSRN